MSLKALWLRVFPPGHALADASRKGIDDASAEAPKAIHLALP